MQNIKNLAREVSLHVAFVSALPAQRGFTTHTFLHEICLFRSPLSVLSILTCSLRPPCIHIYLYACISGVALTQLSLTLHYSRKKLCQPLFSYLNFILYALCLNELSAFTFIEGILVLLNLPF